MENPTKPKLKIVRFSELRIGACFRYNHRWCKKAASLTYLDNGTTLRPMRQFSQALVVGDPNDCR